jgi:hexosaminidase
MKHALLFLCFAGCIDAAELARARAARDAILPKPASLTGGEGSFTVDESTRIEIATDTALGSEGYRLLVEGGRIQIVSADDAGRFYARQTLAQMWPPSGRGLIAEAHIRDQPRFAWRGLMVDVARHFFGVDEIKRYIEVAAHYKLNRLHLHLSDDQGWRLEIRSRPKLTEIGAASAVGGGPGGFYTQADYLDLVAYAAQRFVTLIPELDVPGHCNAALSSYAELNCDGIAPPPYTGTTVGLSAICGSRDETWRFLDDVIGEVAALSPGGWLHIGGDEAHMTNESEYIAFITRLRALVESHGLSMMGWEEISRAGQPALAQLWLGQVAPGDDTPVVLSPAANAYLDMKYDAATPAGTSWVGYVEVDQSYDWDPADHPGQPVGVEGALWTEYVVTRADADLLIFPRLLGLAEIGWSPREGRSFAEYRLRLGAQGTRLAAMGVGFYRSPLVDWR